ncbi:unnamed protein product [Arabis nemorensis]|uniref:B box-type domain-containing protein n=1 Tax=Arabis nemorensis TaxID=586526 RepID=A0A565AZL9_9BRAS|nr:unnamed protein product [Arabis nemorensis]
MAEKCHTCRRTTAMIHCVTEALNLCLPCDYMQHYNERDGYFAGHVRYQLCEKCMINPAILLCCEHKINLCQSCYSLDYNCASYGHITRTINRFPQQHHDHNNIHHHEQEHMPHLVGVQRREGMFAMRCNGNNNCERWMFAMNCESCLASNVVVYCEVEDQLLCNNCDRMIHLPEAVPPHMRSVLCVTCKRVSRNFLIGANQFSLPPTPTLAAPEEVSASTGPNQQYSNGSLNLFL